MAYTKEDKVSVYTSLSEKCASIAAELKHFVEDADADVGIDNRTADVEDLDNRANQMAQWSGHFQVQAKRLGLEDDETEQAGA